MSQLTHLNAAGEAHMVDISEKDVTSRIAIAQSVVQLSPKIVAAIASKKIAKGDLLVLRGSLGYKQQKNVAISFHFVTLYR